MRHFRSLFAALLIFGIAATEPAPSDAAPEGQMTWGVHFSLAPTLFEPAETPGIVTPFMVLYALHDALVKPMPGNGMAPSLAESWSLSQGRPRLRVRAPQGREVPQRRARHRRRREVLLRALPRRGGQDAEGQGGGGRGRGSRAGALPAQGAVAGFHDLSTASLATGAGWIVPRKYVEQVGEEGFKKAPVGAGPYRFVSFTPAWSWCWRPTSSTGGRCRA